MSPPRRSSSPAARHAGKARVYRRRRLVALVAAVVLVAALAGVVWAAFGGCGSDQASGNDPALSGGAAQGAGGKDDGEKGSQARLAPSPSPTAWTGPPSSSLKLKLRKTIVDAGISPKSVVSSGSGYVFAQNMMYKHTMTVYDSTTLKLVETIPDSIDAARFRITGHGDTIQGAPVECAFLPDGRFAYVSQYSMFGPGYTEGQDVCAPGDGTDKSYVYRVPLDTMEVDKVIPVGAVPKYLAVTPDQKYLLVSNWCSYSLSVIDIHTSKVVESVSLGPYPRGIAVSPDSKTAYVAVMGSFDIAEVDLEDFSVSWIRGVGSGPRHLCMAPDGKYLYATLNGEGNVAKIDPKTRRVVDKVATGAQPRSMAIAPDGKSLFVVNYDSSTMSQIRTGDMKVVDTVGTNALPIGITYDAPTRSVWVCCYTGSIMVFRQV
jgi:YVTN family beta-propeller protein